MSRLISIGALLLLAACAASADRPVYLALPTVANANPAPPGGDASAQHALVVRRVSVPEYIDAREVRYRSSASRLDSFPSTVWAERLELGMTRELVGGMRNRLAGWAVCNQSCSDRSVDAVLSVDWSTLDLDRGAHTLAVEAQWVLIDPAAKPGAPLATSRFVRSIPVGGDDADAYAQSIAKAVDLIADDVAQRGVPTLVRHP